MPIAHTHDAHLTEPNGTQTQRTCNIEEGQTAAHLTPAVKHLRNFQVPVT
eukprot:COSAG01_NODE_57137_length_314_cov_0.720930_1_plen_49_part_10